MNPSSNHHEIKQKLNIRQVTEVKHPSSNHHESHMFATYAWIRGKNIHRALHHGAILPKTLKLHSKTKTCQQTSTVNVKNFKFYLTQNVNKEIYVFKFFLTNTNPNHNILFYHTLQSRVEGSDFEFELTWVAGRGESRVGIAFR